MFDSFENVCRFQSLPVIAELKQTKFTPEKFSIDKNLITYECTYKRIKYTFLKCSNYFRLNISHRV